MNIVALLYSILTVSEKLNPIVLTKTNHISITGEITKNTVSKFIYDIETIKKKEIYVYINSVGGLVDAGLDIIQYMNYTQMYNNVTLLCIAHKAYSMAFHILQHCTYRYITYSSQVMQHQVSIERLGGSLENINNYLTIINKKYKEIIGVESRRLKITPDEYRIRIATDWWLTGIDIIQNNVADKLVSFIGCHSNLHKDNNIIVQDGNILYVSDCPLV